eukprot:13682392-Alexandrium_andersonii.AAC.1
MTWGAPYQCVRCVTRVASITGPSSVRLARPRVSILTLRMFQCDEFTASFAPATTPCSGAS